MKCIVIYYSLTGNTKLIAEVIARSIKADLEQLALVKPMPQGFTKFIIGGYQAIFNREPKLKPYTIDFSKYDLIFLGSPIWGGKIASPINTFLNDEGLHDKKICFFSTSGGIINNLETLLKPKINKTNHLLNCLSLVATANNLVKNQEKVTKWALANYKLHK